MGVHHGLLGTARGGRRLLFGVAAGRWGLTSAPRDPINGGVQAQARRLKISNASSPTSTATEYPGGLR